MEKSEHHRVHCNNCDRETNHDELKRHVAKGTEIIKDDRLGDFDINWIDTYELFSCRGCDAATMKVSSWWDAAEETTVRFYPPPIARRVPIWKTKLPAEASALVDEVYDALGNDCRRLALMGARTLLDLLMLDQVGDVGTFHDKLLELEKKGVVGSRNREMLMAALDAGNAAAHRGYKPTIDQLNSVMDIVENILQTVYHLEDVAKEIKKATPPRNK